MDWSQPWFSVNQPLLKGSLWIEVILGLTCQNLRQPWIQFIVVLKSKFKSILDGSQPWIEFTHGLKSNLDWSTPWFEVNLRLNSNMDSSKPCFNSTMDWSHQMIKVHLEWMPTIGLNSTMVLSRPWIGANQELK